MAETTSLTIQIDNDLKEKAESLFSRFGLNMTEAINLFVRKSVDEDRFPFEIEDDFDLDGPYTEEEDAILYHPKNVAAILEGFKQLDEGKGIEVTVEELRAMIK